jgi:hypothetical protein
MKRLFRYIVIILPALLLAAAPTHHSEAATVFLEELIVPNTRPEKMTSRNVLVAGQEYVIEASGTIDDWGNTPHGIDAVWCFAEWRCGRNGEVWDQLRINGKGMNEIAGPIPYNAQHVYRISFQGQGKPVEFFCSDALGSPGDNLGALTVRIYSAGSIPLAATTKPGENLIRNGDFSAGNTEFSSAYTFMAQANSLYNSQTYAVGSDPTFFHPYYKGRDHTSRTGKFLVVNGATAPDATVWAQTVPVAAGKEYRLSAWICSLYPENPAQLRFLINGQVVGAMRAPAEVNRWIEFTGLWRALSTQKVEIRIVETGLGYSGNDFGLDDIAFKETGNAATPVITAPLPSLPPSSPAAGPVSSLPTNPLQEKVEDEFLTRQALIKAGKLSFDQAFGNLEEWMIKVGEYRFFLEPFSGKWHWYDRIHGTWEDTGFEPGQAVFTALNGRLHVTLKKERTQ